MDFRLNQGSKASGSKMTGMLFIAADGRVVNIAKRTVPHSLKSISSAGRVSSYGTGDSMSDQGRTTVMCLKGSPQIGGRGLAMGVPVGFVDDLVDTACIPKLAANPTFCPSSPTNLLTKFVEIIRDEYYSLF